MFLRGSPTHRKNRLTDILNLKSQVLPGIQNLASLDKGTFIFKLRAKMPWSSFSNPPSLERKLKLLFSQYPVLEPIQTLSLLELSQRSELSHDFRAASIERACNKGAKGRGIAGDCPSFIKAKCQALALSPSQLFF